MSWEISAADSNAAVILPRGHPSRVGVPLGAFGQWGCPTMREFSPTPNPRLSPCMHATDMAMPKTRKHRGPLAAVVAASLLLGGGLLGALDLGSSPAVQPPAVLEVTAATAKPGSASGGASSLTGTPSPTSAPTQSAYLSLPAVIAPNRPVVIFAPAHQPPTDTPEPTDTPNPTGS
jgi:hypothetical protein